MRPASIASALTRPPWLFRNFTRLGMSGIGVLLGAQVVPVIDPYFDADMPLGSLGLGKPVFNLCPQGGQRNAARHVLLRPGHLGTAQAAGHLDANALRARLHRLVD